MGLLKDRDIQISMDGAGRWRDNVFIERLWRSLKYEEVYLHAYDTVPETQQRIARYLTFYNQVRPHRASVCRLHLMAPSCAAHLATDKLPSQWSNFRGGKVSSSQVVDSARHAFRHSTEVGTGL